jgi:ankyrin repeat protein
MASPVTACTLFATYGRGYNPQKIITRTTTPEQFDAERAKNPDYQLDNQGCSGHFSLTTAAEQGNVLLIEHIVRIGGPRLLDMGSETGITPLFWAVIGNHRSAAKKLIELGSNVNVISIVGCRLSFDFGITKATTSLAYVANKVGMFTSIEAMKIYGRGTLHPYPIQKAQNVAMAKLLILNGAVAAPAVSEQGAEVLKRAQEEINGMQAALKREIFVNTEFLPIPLVLVEMIASYVPLKDIPETTPELPDPLYPEDPYWSEFPELFPADNSYSEIPRVNE